MAKRKAPKAKAKKPVEGTDLIVMPETADHEMPAPFAALTQKERLFVMHYMMHGNGTAAVKSAGYAGTPGSLRVLASKLLTNGNIRAAIDFLVKPKLDKAGVTVERVVDRLSEIGFAPWRDFVKLKMSNPDPESGEEPEVINATILLKDQIAALRILADYLGMLKGDGNLSQHLHLHFPRKDISAEEARQELLGYLRQRGVK